MYCTGGNGGTRKSVSQFNNPGKIETGIAEIKLYYKLCKLYIICGPGSSVGIATEYGLDGPGSNPGGDEIFRPSRPALGLTQPPVK